MFYLIDQEEKGTDGFQHWQGAIACKPTRWSTIHVRFPGVHVERVKSWPDAIKYCTKADTSIPGTQRVFGEPPMQGHRSDWDDIRDNVTLGQITEIPIEYLVRYPRGIQFAQSLLYEPARTRKVEVIVYWGPTNVGKTHRALEHTIGKTWWMMEADHIWFDGYHGQEVAIIDEFDPAESGISLRKMLQLLDERETRVNTKGGFTYWKPNTVIITTNIDPSYWWYAERDKVIRRITSIIPCFKRRGL